MNLKPIISEIADEADALLSDARNVKEASGVLSEHVQAHHADLSGDERQEVVRGVVAILEAEGFFDGAETGAATDDLSLGEPE